MPKVKVYGIIESGKCDSCGFEDEKEEFDIIVERDVMVGVMKMADGRLYLDKNGEYIICTGTISITV